ncbi:MAG: hypothetical protein JXR46_16570 [Calditrichaceae bacterium]|nr:hypothetical protein [Calditrichaceae bacterium]
MKKLILIILLMAGLIMAGDVGGSLSTGIFTGTPFWNKDNINYDASDLKYINYDDMFIRSVNQLRLYGKNFSGFDFRLNALRSDALTYQEKFKFNGILIGEDNRLNNTKIYELFAQYNFSLGYIQAGRIMPFNRWIMTSIDGGGFSLDMSRKIRITAVGGMSVKYGKIWDDENTQTIAYADAAYQSSGYRVKLKYYHDDDIDKAGADFYGGLKKLRFNGNYGYDFTNDRLADGGLNLSYPVKRNILLSGNYLLYRTQNWYFTNVVYNPYMIERFMLGARYLMDNNIQVDFKQLLAMNSERSDYLTYLTVTHKFFTAGVNYLTGGSDMQRFGATLGGNYSPMQNMMISLGISPVDYMFYDTEDHEFSTAVYLRIKYRFMENFQAMGNLNYYDNNNALHANLRGGVRIQYNFGS